MNLTRCQEALLGLLRFGEVSAAAAFARMLRGLGDGTVDRVVAVLTPIEAEEHQHVRWLVEYCDRHSLDATPPTRGARMFFTSLAGGGLDLHLARIAALDGCVCQILTQVLRVSSDAEAIYALLQSIRRDEARHVAVTRSLALQLGMPDTRLAELNLDTRWKFAQVLHCYRPCFEAMAIDCDGLIARIRRDERA